MVLYTVLNCKVPLSLRCFDPSRTITGTIRLGGMLIGIEPQPDLAELFEL
jgi:hypothetical protein